MSATYVGVTPSLPSYNPNATRTDERPVQLTRTDGHVTQMDGHDDNPELGWEGQVMRTVAWRGLG